MPKDVWAMRKKRMKRNFTEEALAKIRQLYGEIQEIGLSAVRTSLPKAIEIGEQLCRIRAGHRVPAIRKGEWSKVVKGKLPFSRATAYNYIVFFERRDELKCLTVRTVGEAMPLLYPPQLKLVSGKEARSDPSTEAALRSNDQPVSTAADEEQQPVES